MMIWRRLRLTLLSVLLLVVVTLALLGSQPGVQLARLAALYLVPGLQIGAVSGDWWRGLTLTDLGYQTPQLSARVKQLALAFDHRCWQAQQICLSRLQLQQPELLLLQPTPHIDSPADQQPATPAGAANESAAPDTDADITGADNTGADNTGADITGDTTADRALASAHWQLRVAQLEVHDLHVADQQSATPYSLQLASLQSGLALSLSEVPQLQLQHSRLHDLRFDAATDQSSSPAALENPLPMLQQLQLPLLITSSDFALSQASLHQSGQPARQLQHLRWQQLVVNTSQWQLSGADLSLPLPPELSALPSAETAATPLLQVQINASLQSSQQLQLALKASTGAHTLTLTGAGAWQQWPLVLSAEQTSTGLDGKSLTNSVKITGQLNLQDERLPFALQASAATLNQLDLQLQQLTIGLSGDLRQQKFQLQTNLQHPQLPAAQLQLSGTLAGTKLDLTQLQVNTLNGHIEASASVELATGTLQGTIRATELQSGLFWPDYPGTISGHSQFSAQLPTSAAPQQWQVKVSDMALDGEVRALPLQLQGSFMLSQTSDSGFRFHSAGLRANHGPNQLQLQGEVAQDWQLQASINIPDLSYSLALTEGALQGELNISGPTATPNLQLQLQANKLNYLDDYALDKLELTAKINQLGQSDSQIRLIASTGQAPGWQLQQLQWQLDGTLASHHSHLALDSHQLKLAAALEAGLTAQAWQLNLNELRLQSDFGDWQLASASQMTFGRARAELSLHPLCLLEQDSALCLRSTTLLSSKQGEIQLGIGHLALADLSALLPDNISLDGRLNGELSIRWRAHQLQQFSYDLSSPHGLVRHQLTTAIELPWQQLQSTGSLSDDQLSAQISGELVPQSPFSAKVNLSALRTKAPQLDAALSLSPLSLKFLQSALTELQQIDGLLSANLTARGPLTNPAVYGQLALDQVILSGPQVPIELKSANLLASFNGYQANLNSHWQTPEGLLSWTGSANWLTPAAWFVRMDVNGEQLHTQFLDSELVVSPQLSLTASPHSGQISGQILLPSGHIRFNSLPESATAVSADEVIISDHQRQSRNSGWQLSSDVRLKIADQVRLSAFGLKTRLHGDLRVRQQGLVPSLHGQVLLKDGQFRAYGQDLTLRKGRLTFNGPASQPLLAIEAIRNPEKTEDEVIAGIRVNGLADNPVVQVFSEPSKPQANALAYLLLGRDIGSSAGDGAVTTSLIGIGIANSGQLVGAIGEAFGISDLSLDTAGSGDKSKVMVSGYLSPRLQVKYGVGIFSQFGEFTLRYRLMKQFYLEAVQGLATSVDLLYKVEFD